MSRSVRRSDRAGDRRRRFPSERRTTHPDLPVQQSERHHSNVHRQQLLQQNESRPGAPVGKGIRRVHAKLHENHETGFHGHRVHVGTVDRGRARPREPIGRPDDIDLVRDHVRVHCDLVGPDAIVQTITDRQQSHARSRRSFYRARVGRVVGRVVRIHRAAGDVDHHRGHPVFGARRRRG